MNIEFKNRPRCTGKTTELKLYLHEHCREYDKIVIVGHNYTGASSFFRYAKYYCSYVISSSTCDNLRGTRQAKILVLIDEPFLISKERQSDILHNLGILKHKGCDITVFGIGTKESQSPFDKFVS